MPDKQITVQLSHVGKLADIICDFDEEQSQGISKERVKKLVDDAHTALTTMLGEHAQAIYAKEEAA